jgi:hypothetical protein
LHAAADLTAIRNHLEGECVKPVSLFGRAQKEGYHNLPAPSRASSATHVRFEIGTTRRKNLIVRRTFFTAKIEKVPDQNVVSGALIDVSFRGRRGSTRGLGRADKNPFDAAGTPPGWRTIASA